MTTKSLSHHLDPVPGQSLLGFALAVDRVNHVPLGSTTAAVARTSWTRVAQAPLYASGRGLGLVRLAELAGTTVGLVEQTTFLHELRRLLDTDEPSLQTLGQIRFRLCPPCWRAAIVHRKDSLLGGVVGCPEHLILLLSECLCSARLGLARDELGVCASCGRKWSELPTQLMTEVEQEMNARVLRAYDLLFGLDVPLRSSATRPLRRYLTKRRKSDAAVPMVDMRTVSVERLVALVALLDADPDLVAEMLMPQDPPCPNATCPRYTEDASAFTDVEAHCPICGTRFVGPRILSTFDVEHGQSRPSSKRVRAAQRRLARWRRSLRAAAREIAEEDREVAITEAFRRAGVPLNANLRASRLGLTSIVRAEEARRRATSSPWRFVLQGQVRRAATKPDLVWLGKWRTAVGRPYLPGDLLSSPRHPRSNAWY